jgi:hypothetical protein
MMMAMWRGLSGCEAIVERAVSTMEAAVGTAEVSEVGTVVEFTYTGESNA